MNKEDIVNIVSKEASITKRKSDQAVKAVFSAISDALSRGEKVRISNFGSFTVKYRAPRSGRDVRKNIRVFIPAKNIPHFIPGKALRALVESRDQRNQKE